MAWLEIYDGLKGNIVEKIQSDEYKLLIIFKEGNSLKIEKTEDNFIEVSVTYKEDFIKEGK